MPQTTLHLSHPAVPNPRLWGLIPCGLVYMMLLRTLDGGDWRMGAAGMAAFGLGNAPLLLGLGLASTRLSQAWKAILLRVGGLFVAGMGGGWLINLKREKQALEVAQADRMARGYH